MDLPQAAIESDLVDLTGVSIEVLDMQDDRILAPAMARLLQQIADPQNSVAGSNS
ncbi:hypothetical protein [Wenjunlia tyrosinilytica]|uniref:Uncharacterized protein n=1 Tax=Wenjunlia tyrosinilytica TaxID=1544741 RepID=A0A917ZTR4_9ACTN|nr:hypothetical protein [Wenjunlia tyrosinilytica]GGO92372.1 hypothetical protein GCM10012280_42400 [Wenjunlia tyrosinilytica]